MIAIFPIRLILRLPLLPIPPHSRIRVRRVPVRRINLPAVSKDMQIIHIFPRHCSTQIRPLVILKLFYLQLYWVRTGCIGYIGDIPVKTKCHISHAGIGIGIFPYLLPGASSFHVISIKIRLQLAGT